MTLLVPFGGSELAEAALVRAAEFGVVFEEDVLAVSVVPQGNDSYARERGWLDGGESFDLELIVSRLHEQLVDLCPSANFRHKVVDRRAQPGTIANRIRQVARDEDVSMVFLGSENAGRIVSVVSSVGKTVAAGEGYDVVIVRDRQPARIERLREASPYRKEKSDFYLPG